MVGALVVGGAMATSGRYANGHARRKVRAAVLATETHCALCGQWVDTTLPMGDPMAAEIDEIIPHSLGGSPYDRSNAQLTHRHCNLEKSNAMPAQSLRTSQEW